MAIKDNKIPSPSEVKATPQSFSQQEINDIKNLKTEINKLTVQFGQLCIQKYKLEEKEIQLKNKMKNLEEQESSIAKTLTSKYGKGSIDLETGTFTPAE